jgi:hypothetical protein
MGLQITKRLSKTNKQYFEKISTAMIDLNFFQILTFLLFFLSFEFLELFCATMIVGEKEYLEMK